jgi:hypothetical protein
MVKVRVAHTGVSLRKEQNTLKLQCNDISEGYKALPFPTIEQ